MFITFEGLDFCGKSTQVDLLGKYFIEKNEPFEVIREPGGTEISEKIRNILLDKSNSRMLFETEVLLFSASRAQLVREFILPGISKGLHIISDRFHDSSTAYQGYGRGVSLNFLNKLNSFVIENAIPDITFFIDISVEELMNRKSKIKKNELDRIELSKQEFYERVRQGYLTLCNENPRFITIDGSQSINQIHTEIISSLSMAQSIVKETNNV